MSDNLPPEVVQQELEARLQIPTEVWTDVFKLLPRRVLVQQVAPVCFYFKEISNKNVKNVHVIQNAYQFKDKLDKDDPEANQQLEQLAGNQCQLASQFRLTYLWISEKSKVILRHCPDLFDGCIIVLDFKEENRSSTVFSECLTELGKAKPIEIGVSQVVDQAFDFWHHPTFQNCSRASLALWFPLSAASRMNIFNWLHHQPNGEMDCDVSAATEQQQVRCMIVWFDTETHDHIDWLLERCSEDIQQAREPTDRRSFVLSFYPWDSSDWPGFGQFRRTENKSTGEVLLLGRVMNDYGEPTYRLRRCLAEEEASGKDFYAGIFDRDHGYGYDAFKSDEKTPKVLIG